MGRSISASLFLLCCFGFLGVGDSNAESRRPAAENVASFGAEKLEGVLTIVWSDPRSGGPGGQTFFTLNMPDGTRMSLDLAGMEGQAYSYFGRRVTVTGRTSRDARGLPRVAVDTIAAADGGTARRPAVTGTRRVLFLLVKFSDDTAVPHPPQFYNDLTNPDEPPPGAPFPATINGFFKKTSWN